MKSVLKNSLIVALAVGVISATCFSGTNAVGQEAAMKKKPAAKKRRAPNPAFQPPTVQAGLPNVLLIGDSISIGYMVPAREALKGVANVWRPATNCGPTTTGVKGLENWLGDRKWDVIHFNFGLHDLKYIGPKGQSLTDPNASDSQVQVPLDQYTANLHEIATRLKKTGATVIWRQTTPVPEGVKGRVVGDSKKYNDAAAKVMEEIGGIQTDALFEFARNNADQLPANVHYSKKGSQSLGNHVAEVVKKALESHAKK